MNIKSRQRQWTTIWTELFAPWANQTTGIWACWKENLRASFFRTVVSRDPYRRPDPDRWKLRIARPYCRNCQALEIITIIITITNALHLLLLLLLPAPIISRYCHHRHLLLLWRHLHGLEPGTSTNCRLHDLVVWVVEHLQQIDHNWCLGYLFGPCTLYTYIIWYF